MKRLKSTGKWGKDLSNENVIHVKKDGIEYLQFKKLLEYSDIIAHAYSLGIDKNFRTKKGNNIPVSEEEAKKAQNNYKELTQSIGSDFSHVVKTNQKHTKNVK